MKKILFLIFPIVLFGQTNKNACETLFQINKVIQDQHYKPKALNDSLSKYVFNAFLSELDDNNRLFLAGEIHELSKYQYTIDDHINNKNCTFLNDFYQMYLTAVKRNIKIYEQVAQELTTFESKESIQFSKNAFSYVASEHELKNRVKKSIIFQILKNIAETSKNKDSLTQHFSKLSLESKKKIIEQNNCKLNKLDYSLLEFNTLFFNVFCSYFDPHTAYFSEDAKTNFLNSVSSDSKSFGLNVSLNENDEVIVDKVIPGSSAYFTEKIESSDQIISVKSNREDFEISCLNISKFSEILSNNDFKNALFTLRKKNGNVYKVALQKKEVTNYENTIYSFILKKESKKIGYIKIPSFYGEIGQGKTTVSDDVAKEIYKLKKDNIDGLIIDVQNNGGGSMSEAIKLTSMFIDIGPLAIMNNHENKTSTIRDPNRGLLYNGPMVVLVNAYSASASEFFTNAIQDYNRGIIVGNKTRGKATMQTIVSLDEENKEYIKITVEGFYRITGKSNQGIGIFPDVEIPNLFDNQIQRENQTPNAIINDEVVSIMKFNSFLNPKKVETLLKSQNRLKNNKNSNAINAINSKIDKLYNNYSETITLNFNSVFEEVSKFNLLWQEISDFSKKEFPIEIEQTSTDIEYQKFDEFTKSNTLEKLKEIKNNFHIFEAINIIKDLTE